MEEILPPPDPPAVPSPPTDPPAPYEVDTSPKGAQPEAMAVRELILAPRPPTATPKEETQEGGEQ